MPARRSASSASPEQKGQMMFLVGHGLQSPLSSIRWGCSRLKKMTKGSLSPEELHILDGVQNQAKMLSGMLSALLLVARTDDGSYVQRKQDMYLLDLLTSFGPFREVFPGKHPVISCPDHLQLHVDRVVLESALEAIAVILSTAALPDTTLKIDVTVTDTECRIDFLPEIELSFLRDLSAMESGSDSPQMVGGAPGLMLSIVTSLCRCLGGTLDVKKKGTEHHLLSLTLPLHPSSGTPLPS